MKPWERVWAATTQEELAALWNEVGPFSADLKMAADARLSDPSTPRCTMCVRPARWVTTLDGRGEWGQYCAGRACSNKERACQRCGELFAPRVDGASGKYCSQACQQSGGPYLSLVTHACARCGKLGRGSDRLWPYVCGDCRYPIRHVVKQLRDHRVPWSMVVRLFDDPTCDICPKNLLELERRPGSGRLRAALVVDHDHSCKRDGCGAHSCGQCVRGFLCSQCNTGIGLFHEDLDKLQAAAEYVRRWRNG